MGSNPPCFHPRRFATSRGSVFLLVITIWNFADSLDLRGETQDARLIGWGGESYRASDTAPKDVLQMSQVQVLSWKPRASLAKQLLTPEECDHLISISARSLQRSGVVDVESGKPLESNIRTSQGTFLGRGQDAIVQRIEEKIATWAQIPSENGEGLQVLKYNEGNEYKAHYDYFFHKEANENGGNRMATVLLYLNDVEGGGETVFPLANPPKEWQGGGWSDCGQAGLGVRPKKGDALLFFSLKPNGLLETFSKHAGCPVTAGEKWTATKWMHVGPFMSHGRAKRVDHVLHVPSPPPYSENCKDDNAAFCRGWAEQGECETNAGYMKESCKYSCGSCDPA